MGLELLELELPALGQAQYLGSMHKMSKLGSSRIFLLASAIAVIPMLFFSWWVQTTVNIGDLDSKFDVEKIIRQVEIQSDAYTVRGTKNLFQVDQNRKISKISLTPGRSLIGKSDNAKSHNTVFVHAWKSGNSTDPIMYSCRFSDADKLTISRIYLEGSQ